MYAGIAWFKMSYPWILRQASYAFITCARIVPLRPEVVCSLRLERLELVSTRIAPILIGSLELIAMELLHERCLHGVYVQDVTFISPSN